MGTLIDTGQGQVIQALVRAFVAVKVGIVVQASLQLLGGGVAFQIDVYNLTVRHGRSAKMLSK